MDITSAGYAGRYGWAALPRELHVLLSKWWVGFTLMLMDGLPVFTDPHSSPLQQEMVLGSFCCSCSPPCSAPSFSSLPHPSPLPPTQPSAPWLSIHMPWLAWVKSWHTHPEWWIIIMPPFTLNFDLFGHKVMWSPFSCLVLSTRSLSVSPVFSCSLLFQHKLDSLFLWGSFAWILNSLIFFFLFTKINSCKWKFRYPS